MEVVPGGRATSGFFHGSLTRGLTAAIPILYELKGVKRDTAGHSGLRDLLLELPWVAVMADVDTF